MRKDSHETMKKDSDSGNGEEKSKSSGKGHRLPTSRSEVTPFLDALNAGPELDQDKVARARKLLQKEGYPSDEVLEAIARQLARDWPGEQGGSRRRM